MSRPSGPRTRIWAAGVQASPLAKQLAAQVGVETDRAGRVPVEPDCSLPGHPEVFAIGDMVSLNNLPGVAQPAMQEGKYVGKLIKARLDGDTKVEPFQYFDKGSMATIGRRSAVAHAFGMNFTGLIGYFMWGVIHVMYLIGWATGSARSTRGCGPSASPTAAPTASSPSSRPTSRPEAG